MKTSRVLHESSRDKGSKEEGNEKERKIGEFGWSRVTYRAAYKLLVTS